MHEHNSAELEAKFLEEGVPSAQYERSPKRDGY